ncbi:MAG: hypothetical protein AAGA60_12005 [Cyanobacteria bacterium P01_E01_bin.42]
MRWRGKLNISGLSAIAGYFCEIFHFDSFSSLGKFPYFCGRQGENWLKQCDRLQVAS